ncbi:hypothetical protein ACHAPJ_007491 [Fusarium lateritium]
MLEALLPFEPPSELRAAAYRALHAKSSATNLSLAHDASSEAKPRHVWQDNSQTLTYEELRRENQRLRKEINALRTQREQLSLSPSVQAAAVCPEQQPRNATDCSQDGLDDELWESLASESAIRSSTVSSWEDIILPTVECSRRLIDFDMMWNSWVHYALEYPRFKEESDAFMDSIETGLSIEQAETTWVAVYFSVLSVSPSKYSNLCYSGSRLRY